MGLCYVNILLVIFNECFFGLFLSCFFTIRYYELDPHKSLLDNLRNKVIIEYPTLHVVLKEFSNDMKVLHQGKCKFVPVMLRITSETEAIMTVFISLYMYFLTIVTHLTEFTL